LRAILIIIMWVLIFCFFKYSCRRNESLCPSVFVIHRQWVWTKLMEWWLGSFEDYTTRVTLKMSSFYSYFWSMVMEWILELVRMIWNSNNSVNLQVFSDHPCLFPFLWFCLKTVCDRTLYYAILHFLRCFSS